MVRTLERIEIEGEKVDLLFTPSLFLLAQRRGVTVTIEDTNNIIEVMDAYTKLFYLSALNAWEVKRFDDPELEEFKFKLIHFSAWATTHQNEFTRLMKTAIAALTYGKDNSKEVKKK